MAGVGVDRGVRGFWRWAFNVASDGRDACGFFAGPRKEAVGEVMGGKSDAGSLGGGFERVKAELW